MNNIYIFVVIGIVFIISIIFMIISIREQFLNKKKSEKTNDFKTSLEGISGKELYDTFSDQKTKYKDFIENVNNEN